MWMSTSTFGFGMTGFSCLGGFIGGGGGGGLIGRIGSL
jgi:hypothetical protein